MREKTTIGRAEKTCLPDFGGLILNARIDTGAKTSSIWAQDIVETDDGLTVVICGIKRHFFHYSRVRVASSMGHEQTRFKIKTPIIIKKRRIMATFTLADRSKQVYPVLIGRSTLNGKFIVDVSRGTPLRDEEKKRSEILQAEIIEENI